MSTRQKAASKLFSLLSLLAALPRRIAYRSSSLDAWCDGLLINGKPWHCIVCTRLRDRVAGVKRRSYLKECNPFNLGVCVWEMTLCNQGQSSPNSHTHLRWVLPATKYVYPLPEMLGDCRQKIMRGVR